MQNYFYELQHERYEAAAVKIRPGTENELKKQAASHDDWNRHDNTNRRD